MTIARSEGVNRDQKGSIGLSTCLSIYISIYLCVCLSVCLSVPLFVCLFAGWLVALASCLAPVGALFLLLRFVLVWCWARLKTLLVWKVRKRHSLSRLTAGVRYRNAVVQTIQTCRVAAGSGDRSVHCAVVWCGRSGVFALLSFSPDRRSIVSIVTSTMSPLCLWCRPYVLYVCIEVLHVYCNRRI